MNLTSINLNFNLPFFILIIILLVLVIIDWRYKKVIYGEDTFANSKQRIDAYINKKYSQNEKRKIEGKEERNPEKIFINIANVISQCRFVTQKYFFNPVVLLVFFILYFEFIEVTIVGFPSNISSLLLFNPTDQNTLDFINMIGSFFKYLIPITLPFYYFSYREQKNMSDSSINGKNRNTYYILFLFVSISAVIYSFNLAGVFANQDMRVGNLKVTSEYISDVILLVFYSVLAVYFLGSFVINFLKSLSLKNILRKKMNKVFLNYTLLSFCQTEKLHKYYNEQLTYQVESVYQLLRQAAEKDIGEIYATHNKEWGAILEYILIDYRMDSFDTTTKHLHLLNRNGDLQNSLYKTILKNHLSLIKLLVKVHKVEDAKKSISRFMSFLPKPTLNEIPADDSYEKYLSNYYVTLYELSLYLYEQNNVNLYPILDALKNESESNEAVELEGIVRNLQALLIKSVEANDVNNISTVSYYLITFFYKLKNDNEVPLQEQSQTTSQFNETTEENMEILEFEEIEFENGTKEGTEDNNFSEVDINTNYSSASIFILLQVLAKSLEISHYSCSGFIVKFLVTNIAFEDLNKVLKEFSKNSSENIFLNKSENYTEIDTDFHLNSKVERYILSKLALLIYTQQLYMSNQKVKLLNNSMLQIDINSYIDEKNKFYVVQKISNAKLKYGLLSLQDEENFNKVKEKLNIKCCASKDLLSSKDYLSETVKKPSHNLISDIRECISNTAIWIASLASK